MSRIRHAGCADAPALNAALAALSRDLGDTHRVDDAALAKAGWGDAPLFRALLAEDDGGAVTGVTLYSARLSTARGGPVAWVSDLWVSPAARGTGLGRRLLDAAADDAAETWGAIGLALAVYDRTPGARAFYDRLGFAPMTGQTELHRPAPGRNRAQTRREP